MKLPFGSVSLILSSVLALSPALVAAKPTVKNLGGGLEQLATPAGRTEAMAQAESLAAGGGAGLEASHRIVLDDSGRALVRITLDGKLSTAALLQKLKLLRGVEVVASDPKYRKGAIEAYVPGDSLIALAGTQGVLAVVPASPVMTNVGLTDSQGVVQHRVDQTPGVDGAGITVGVMSDSFDTNAAPCPNCAASDVASGDLPGPGNPNGNTEPVVVLEDVPGGTDEGRAMLQIVHDLAPKARLGYATAFGGELNFADNIRSLAGFGPRSVPGFEADVIVDDIIYLAEPFFQDGPVAQAVDEVAAKGVSYFSSAGNRPATMAYDSEPRIVPASEAADSGLNFAAVDPALFAGAASIAWADEAAVRAALAAASESWNRALDARDAAAMAALATEDVVLLSPDSSPIAGRSSVREAWERALAGAATKVTAANKETEIAGDIAWRIDAYTHRLPNGAVVSAGQSLQVWKRVDGEWKIHRIMTPIALTGPALRPRPAPNEPVLDSPPD